MSTKETTPLPKTFEGFEVGDEFGLRLMFSPLVWAIEKQSSWCLFAAIEHNTDSYGRKRPYLIVQMGKLVIQSGWLFG